MMKRREKQTSKKEVKDKKGERKRKQEEERRFREKRENERRQKKGMNGEQNDEVARIFPLEGVGRIKHRTDT